MSSTLHGDMYMHVRSTLEVHMYALSTCMYIYMYTVKCIVVYLSTSLVPRPLLVFNVPCKTGCGLGTRVLVYNTDKKHYI